MEDALTGIPIAVASQIVKPENGYSVVRLGIRVDLGPLQFVRRRGRHEQRSMFIGAMLNPAGEIVAAKEGAIEFSLKDKTLARLRAEGINAWLTLSAHAGRYRLRVVVQDADGKMAARTRAVVIPNQVHRPHLTPPPRAGRGPRPKARRS